MSRVPTGLRVAAAPFALSAVLSLSTVGDGPFWQDSGAYLVAVRELGVLYPHGFVLYLLLCKAWTGLLFFVPFTLAVHLFSSTCAAFAAAVLALATRAWLRSSGAALGLGAGAERGALADWAAAGAGCLAASGYTFWFSGIYAKGYSLYYLLLALTLHAMIRADESRRPRDLTVVAALFGLCWAAHPAAALLGPAFLLYVATQRRTLRPLGILWRAALSAACALVPLLLLPVLAAREPGFQLGNPRGLEELLEYATGRRFTGMPSVFGFTSSRFSSFPRFLWEEFLVAGTFLLGLGLFRIGRTRPALLAGLAAWLVPYSLVTLLFKIEGQHDCWLVAAWLPLHLAAGLGLRTLAVAAGRRGLPALAGAVLLGAGGAAFYNHPLLNQRGYSLAEDFARAHLDPLDPGAILLVEGDDVAFLCDYEQRIARRRTDVVLVSANRLGIEEGDGPGWYERKLLAAHPFLRPSSRAGLSGRFPSMGRSELAKAAFIRANAPSGRPIFFSGLLPDELLPEGYAQTPAGGLWKVEAGRGDRIDLRYWDFPVQAEDVARRYRRARGQTGRIVPGRIEVEPEPYERRLLLYLLGARANLADVLLNRREWAEAARAYESLIALEDWYRNDGETLFALAMAYGRMGREAQAEGLLWNALRQAATPVRKAETLLELGGLYRRRNDLERAARLTQDALLVPGLDPADRRRLQGRVGSP